MNYSTDATLNQVPDWLYTCFILRRPAPCLVPADRHLAQQCQREQTCCV